MSMKSQTRLWGHTDETDRSYPCDHRVFISVWKQGKKIKRQVKKMYIYKLGYNLSNEHMEGTEIEYGSAEAVMNLVKCPLEVFRDQRCNKEERCVPAERSTCEELMNS